eukprot:CAMPEP_0204451250 /NCGR_PEP_ID=MMETSP0470-20130426/100753_1 /ASSEMBLY_ACC=CAM_ASM_000385 /TAXON_ID=2969 /ORGANISM="Oxyrrhis marina" /LENGTH=1211 /DNA_ID=CAMNT_0051451095 /DNA_START=490 /DNA_END=4126 /DNA_ORIENTATION=+
MKPMQVRVLITGQGRAGKTSLVRSLTGKDHRPDEATTHGLGVSAVEKHLAATGQEHWRPVDNTTATAAADLHLDHWCGDVISAAANRAGKTSNANRSGSPETRSAEHEQAAVQSTDEAQSADSAKLRRSEPQQESLRIKKLGVMEMEVRSRAAQARSPTAEQEATKAFVQLLDFGGQLEYRDVLHVFMGDGGVVMVCFSMSKILSEEPCHNQDADSELSTLRFWLASVFAHAPTAPVILTATHCDQYDAEQLQMKCLELDTIVEQVLDLVPGIGMQLVHNAEKNLSFFPVDNTRTRFPETVVVLRAAMDIAIRSVLDAEQDLPVAWVLALRRLLHLSEGRQNEALPPVLTFDETLAETKEQGVDDAVELDKCLKALSTAGHLLYFPNAQGTTHQVVLDPAWIGALFADIAHPSRADSDEHVQQEASKGRLAFQSLSILWRSHSLSNDQRDAAVDFMSRLSLVWRQGEFLVIPSKLQPMTPNSTSLAGRSQALVFDFRGWLQSLVDTVLPRFLCKILMNPRITVERSLFRDGAELVFDGRVCISIFKCSRDPGLLCLLPRQLDSREDSLACVNELVALMEEAMDTVTEVAFRHLVVQPSVFCSNCTDGQAHTKNLVELCRRPVGCPAFCELSGVVLEEDKAMPQWCSWRRRDAFQRDTSQKGEVSNFTRSDLVEVQHPGNRAVACKSLVKIMVEVFCLVGGTLHRQIRLGGHQECRFELQSIQGITLRVRPVRQSGDHDFFEEWAVGNLGGLALVKPWSVAEEQLAELRQPVLKNAVTRLARIPSSDWGVDMPDLQEFLHTLDSAKMPREATAHEVVDQVVCGETFSTAYSWALQRTRSGKRCSHFVSHTWEESVVEFCKALQALILVDPVFWICFLALPQTWPRDALGRLLCTPFQSPFFVALKDCREVVVVRNIKANLYDRLWCTFELLAAVLQKKNVVVAGRMPGTFATGRGTGSTANCTDPLDRELISGAILGAQREDNSLEAIVNRAMYLVGQAPEKTTVHVSRARGPFWRTAQLFNGIDITDIDRLKGENAQLRAQLQAKADLSESSNTARIDHLQAENARLQTEISELRADFRANAALSESSKQQEMDRMKAEISRLQAEAQSRAAFRAQREDNSLEAIVNRAVYLVGQAPENTIVHVSRARGPFWRTADLSESSKQAEMDRMGEEISKLRAELQSSVGTVVASAVVPPAGQLPPGPRMICCCAM